MPSTVTNRLQGLTTSVAVKAPCRTVATSNIPLSGLQTIGGIAVLEGDRVLVTAQDTGADNGIYEASTGLWSRAADFDGDLDAVQGTTVIVHNGTGNGAFYELTTANPITIGTTGLSFSLRYGANVHYDRTAAETAAGVTPTNYAYPQGDPRRYGAVCDGVTDDSVALASADSVALALGIPIPATGVMHIGTPVTVNAMIADTLGQLFTPTSQVTLAGAPFVRPEWWGSGENALRYAINSLPSSGGVVQLEDKVYARSNFEYGFAGSGVYISKDNVRIIGRKMPKVSDDCTSLEGGTIIQGMVLAYANGFEMRNLGVDCGKDYIDANFGGTPVAGTSDAIAFTYPNDATKAAEAQRRSVRLHDVIGLCDGPDAPSHGVLIEGCADVICTGEVTGFFGTHGVAIKAALASFEVVRAYCNDTNGIVIKSDSQDTAVAAHCQIETVYVSAGGPEGVTPHDTSTTGMGIRVYAADNDVSLVQIGQVISIGYQNGFGTEISNNKTIENIQIGSITTDQSSGAGISATISTGQLQRFHVGNAVVRNCGTGLLASVTNNSGFPGQITVGRLEVINSSDVAVMVNADTAVDIAQLIASNCSAGVYRLIAGCKVNVGSLSAINGTATLYSTSSSGTAPSLSNSWTQYASNDTFGVDLLGGRINLRGLVVPGSTNTISTLPTWARPLTNKRFMVQGYNGSAVTSVPLTIAADGTAQVNEIAGGTANCSTWLSLSGVTYDAQA